MRNVRLALSFLTRLPVGRHPHDASELAAAVVMFPAVGLIVGLLGALVGVGLGQFLPVLTASALAFVVTALATGGFHEDGLADSFDGLAGGWNTEQRLEILKDSRHGTFGVLSILLVTLVKVSAFAAVLESVEWWRAGLVLVAAHSGARGAAVALMVLAPTARQDGLGADYTRQLSGLRALGAATIGLLALAAGLWWWTPVAVAATVIGVGAVGLWSRAKIGGISGDILGAAEQVAECAILCTATLI